jgi:hypothetical protein
MVCDIYMAYLRGVLITHFAKISKYPISQDKKSFRPIVPEMSFFFYRVHVMRSRVNLMRSRVNLMRSRVHLPIQPTISSTSFDLDNDQSTIEDCMSRSCLSSLTSTA